MMQGNQFIMAFLGETVSATASVLMFQIIVQCWSILKNMDPGSYYQPLTPDTELSRDIFPVLLNGGHGGAMADLRKNTTE